GDDDIEQDGDGNQGRSHGSAASYGPRPPLRNGRGSVAPIHDEVADARQRRLRLALRQALETGARLLGKAAGLAGGVGEASAREDEVADLLDLVRIAAAQQAAQ